MQTHIDYSLDSLDLQNPLPKITIYGNRLDTRPIKLLINDFMPYFYIKSEIELEINELEQSIQTNFKKGKLVGFEKTMRQSVYGFSSHKELFYKVYFNTPSCFKSAKEFFESGLIFRGKKIFFKVFESNFNFVLRFMNDLRLSGMSYIKINGCEDYNKDIVHTSYRMIEQLPFDGMWNKLLPLKILSFDIECCGSTDSFPIASRDPIIQIGNTVCRFGQEGQERVIFCLKETANIPDSTVYSFDSEKELLKKWREFFMEKDPDLVLGYNIKNFDFVYILDRAEKLGLKDFGRLGRSERVSKIVNKQQSSNNFGTFDAKDISIDGRLIFDLLHIIRRDYKLRSYSLNSVSVHFLGEQKEDVPYSSMYSLQNESKTTRARIASYCLHDTYLPIKIMDKLNILINYTELSRATYVPIDFFSNRGAAIKVLSQIYRESSLCGYLIPDVEITNDSAPFEGGFVMDPLKGFYYDPIAVLDFSSLYPSIMISKNLCYTTLLTRKQYEEIGGTKTPTDNYFCSSEVKEGLLPRILRNLLHTRKITKDLLKKEKDPALKKSLDGRQLALKICANSIYGFTGALAGNLPCVEISQSTTAFGRDMISLTKRLIEDHFNIKNGFEHDSQVIYGDTDSVMINFFEKDLHKVFELANAASVYVSERFEKPVSLEFEKAYSPYLLINKKRYAGLIYTNPDKPDKIDTKGIETVRRDNCELVKTVIENCLNKILLEKNLAGAQNYVKEMVRHIYLEKIDLSQLVISKTYTKNNYTSKQAHVELAEKLRKRGVTVGIGDRIPYIIVKGDKKMAAYEKSEDPVYVLERNLPIDKEYYIEQQLMKPVQRLFEPIMDNVNSLFSGEHTRVIARGVTMSGPMNAFLTAKDSCVGCKKSGTILCTDCRINFKDHYLEILKTYTEKAQKFNACWKECQRCQGSLFNDVLCVNRVCPIFYMRTKVRNELDPLKKKIDKLKDLRW